MDNILEKIYKIGLKFLVPLTLEENYALIVKEAMKLVKADYGSILVGQKGELQGYIRKVFQTRKPLILTPLEIAKVNHYIKNNNTKSIIVIPLRNRSQPLGVLVLMSLKENYFTQQDINTLRLFSPMATLAIRKTQLYDETQKALEVRDLFISMAAHEFRTPLTTINGYIQLLHSKLSGAETPESRWTEELLREGSRLTLLVNELLAVHRIKSGQFHYVWQECSLKDIIARALRDSRFTHPQRRIVFENKLDGKKDNVIGDCDKLLQVITNLLDNAVKFSPPGKHIMINLEVKLPYVLLRVKDQGQGIAKKDIPEVFESFYQSGHQSKEGGMGLGLFITKEIIKQHRGLIKIRSKKRSGTSVEIRLPVANYLTP